MAKFLVATHGQLASGFQSSLKIIMGEGFDIDMINAFTDDNFNLEIAVTKKLEHYDENEQVLVFTDLMGGSVNREFVKHLQARNIALITGVNLPLLLSFVVTNQESFTQEEIITIIEEAKEQLAYCNMLFDDDTDL